jgi:histidyl-tRNA synthetase
MKMRVGGERMQKVKGTRDLLGKELRAQKRVIEVLSLVFKNHGFREVETPILEPLELFTLRSGETIVRQLYSFEDKSGRKLALRPELTAPVARLYCEKLRSEPKPLRLCYFGSCFRYEEPQAGRWRQFHQAGAEIIGSPLPASEAEIMEMAEEAFERLGVRTRLVVGQISLLRGVLREAGVGIERQDSILRAIDSKDEGRIDQELQRAGVSEEERARLKELISLKGGKEVLEKARKMVGPSPGMENLQAIVGLLEEMGVRFELDLGIARGLDYYTGCVFEFYSGGTQLAGGGRYDELIELIGGEKVPAVGIGFGVDRIAGLLKLEDEPPPDLFVLPVGEELVGQALRIARELRERGVSVEVEVMGRKLSKGLEYADSRGIPQVLIVGKADLAEGRVTLRNMRTGEQRKIELARLPELIGT